MVCIYCKHRTKTTNSRNSKNSPNTWRRKYCPNCKQTWTTAEKPDLAKVFVVKSSTGKLEPLSRDKLYLSVHDSLKHRKSAVSDATNLTDTVINKIITQTNNSTIELADLTGLTQMVLVRFDNHAAAHYQAYQST